MVMASAVASTSTGTQITQTQRHQRRLPKMAHRIVCAVCQQKMAKCIITDNFDGSWWSYDKTTKQGDGMSRICITCQDKLPTSGQGSLQRCFCGIPGLLASTELLDDDGSPIKPAKINPAKDGDAMHTLHELYQYKRFGCAHPRCTTLFQRVFCVMCERIRFEQEFEVSIDEMMSDYDPLTFTTDVRFDDWATTHLCSRSNVNPCHAFGVCRTFCREMEWQMDTKKIIDDWIAENLDKTT